LNLARVDLLVSQPLGLFHARAGRIGGMKQNKRSWGGAVAFAAIVVLTLLVIYVLSSGPMDVFRQRGFISTPAFITLYSPLGFLGRNCPPFYSFMEWYLSLFR